MSVEIRFKNSAHIYIYTLTYLQPVGTSFLYSTRMFYCCCFVVVVVVTVVVVTPFPRPNFVRAIYFTLAARVSILYVLKQAPPPTNADTVIFHNY